VPPSSSCAIAGSLAPGAVSPAVTRIRVASHPLANSSEIRPWLKWHVQRLPYPSSCRPAVVPVMPRWWNQARKTPRISSP
jgi:hypothetical protein